MRAAILALIVLGGCGDDGGDTVCGICDAGPWFDAPISIDAEPYDPLDGIGEVEPVDTGRMFLEGPQWVDARGVLLYTDIPASTIYQLDVADDSVTVLRNPSGNANGLAIQGEDMLLAAEHGNRRVSISVAIAAGTPVTVVDDFEGARLNSPNDLVEHFGTVYFTDPPYGISDADRELDFIGVFRTDGTTIEAIWRGPLSARPNGIALSPDRDTLYVADTADGTLRAMNRDGTDVRVVSTDVPGADGMAVDAAGNLFVTTSQGVRVLAPDGTTWGTIAVPEHPSNCAFGGDDARTLYITARTSLYRVRLAHPGLPTH